MRKQIATATVPRTDIVITIMRTGRSTWITRMSSEAFETDVPATSYTEAEAREMANAFWMDGVQLRNHRESPKPPRPLNRHIERGDTIMHNGKARVVLHITRWTIPPYVLQGGFVRCNRATKMRTFTFENGETVDLAANDYATPAV